MAFKFPFTNYHELNLTWVLDQLKKLFEESAENVAIIENYDGRLSAVETELPLVSETAQGASQTAANAANLAQTAKSTADTAQENAIQAQGLAGQARQEAQAAQNAADAATQAAQQAQSVAQNFDGRITEAQNNASEALEASRSFENRVQAAITTANNAAQTATNAQGIATRADQNAALALDTLNAQRSELERIGAEQVERITEETESGKTEIENLAQSVLDSIPSDYTALSNLVDKKAPVIINSASGSIASFDDGADSMPIRKLVAQIEPVQSGTGDPSPDNVRPISGWTGAEIEQRGKNLLPPFAGEYSSTDRGITTTFAPENVSIIGTSTGTNASSGNMPLASPIKLLAGKTYVFSIDGVGSTPTLRLFLRNASNGNLWYGDSTTCTWTVTPDSDIEVHRVMFRATVNNSTFDVSGAFFCNLNERLAYEPFTGSTISVNWEDEAGTVYGGTLDVTQGKLIITHHGKQMTGASSEGWNLWDGKFVATISGIARYNSASTKKVIIADRFKSAGVRYRNSCGDGEIIKVILGNNYIACYSSAYDNINAFTASLATNPMTVCYELATPIEYQLDPQEIRTLLGTNNVWCDTGDVEVTYPADTKLYIDGKIAELQATILENI